MSIKEQFNSRVTDFYFWKDLSDQMQEAAKAVWNSRIENTIHVLYRPASLLMGLSLEALLKGLIIRQENLDFSDGKLPKPLKIHSLEKLFNRAGIDLEDTYYELELVRTLSDSIEWVSKYPVPLNSNLAKQSKNMAQRPLRRNDNDYDQFEILRQKVLVKAGEL